MKQLLTLFCLINLGVTLTFAQKPERKDIAEYVSKFGYTTIFYVDSVRITDPAFVKENPGNPIAVASLIKPPSSYSPIKNVIFLETDNFIKKREARLLEYVQGKNRMYDAIKEFLLFEKAKRIYFDNLDIEPN